MKTPHEKYDNDPQYRHLVDLIENWLHNAQFTPSEVREAATLACVHFEMRHAMNRHVVPESDIEKALYTLGRWREGKEETDVTHRDK